jgi:hypothetical protein
MSVKGKRAIKGGAPRSRQAPIKAPWLTVDKMIDERSKLRGKMHRGGAVKTPADMVTNPAFLSQLEIIRSFADIKVACPALDKYATVYGNHQSYEECMQISHDNNLMVLLESLSIAIQFSDMEDEYDRGFVNLIKVMVALYQGNPYTRDRIGWLMWSVGKHIYPKCYFPLTIDMYYDPRLWHRPGEYLKEPISVPSTVAFDGTGQEFGPEDDIWDCELPDTRS